MTDIGDKVRLLGTDKVVEVTYVYENGDVVAIDDTTALHNLDKTGFEVVEKASAAVESSRFKLGDHVRRIWTDGDDAVGQVIAIEDNPGLASSPLRICVQYSSGWKYWFGPREIELVDTPLSDQLSETLRETYEQDWKHFTPEQTGLIKRFLTDTPDDAPSYQDVYQWQVKDSGVRQEYASGMVRDTEKGKARFDLLHPLGVPYSAQFLTRCAVHMAQGAEKYNDRNWERAKGTEELMRYRSSALRHLQQWLNNEPDEDHAAAVFFNLLAAETVDYRIRQGF